MIHKMTMVPDSAERLRLFRIVLRSPRLNGRICSTPAQSGHPVELDPQGKVHLRREELQLGAAQREELQLGAAQHEELQLGAAQREEVQLLVSASCRTRV
jgi:hypothetical protein